MRRAASRADCTAGNNNAMRMAIIAITTNNSTRVKAPSLRRGIDISDRKIKTAGRDCLYLNDSLLKHQTLCLSTSWLCQQSGQIPERYSSGRISSREGVVKIGKLFLSDPQPWLQSRSRIALNARLTAIIRYIHSVPISSCPRRAVGHYSRKCPRPAYRSVPGSSRPTSMNGGVPVRPSPV